MKQKQELWLALGKATLPMMEIAKTEMAAIEQQVKSGNNRKAMQMNESFTKTCHGFSTLVSQVAIQNEMSIENVISTVKADLKMANASDGVRACFDIVFEGARGLYRNAVTK